MRQTVSNKTLNKYKDLLKQDIWTETDIISFRSLLNNKLRHDAETRLELASNFNHKTITDEQRIKGYNWLNKYNFTSQGNSSSKCFLGNREAEILKDFDTITIARLRDVGYGILTNYVPVYRVYSLSGQFFEYTFEANGQPTVIG